jgi:hypothetical protein
MLDIKICDRISQLIEKLATSGNKQQIDKILFKQLISFAG